MGESRCITWLVVGGAVIGVVTVAVAGGLLLKCLWKKSHKKYLEGSTIKKPLRFVDREVITHDTSLYTFALPSNEYVLGVPTGCSVFLHARVEGADVKRPYTPVSLNDLVGYTRFIIKTYRKNTDPKFPAGGTMSQYLETLETGDFVDASGPEGHIHYCGDGKFEVSSQGKTLNASHINMICGGSGLTPMFQILKHILNSSSDKTKIYMIFANQTERDILMRDELEQLQDQYSQFTCWFTVESPPPRWTQGVGYIDKQMLEQHCFAAGMDTVNLVCGPPAMISNCCLPNLTALGHRVENILLF